LSAATHGFIGCYGDVRVTELEVFAGEVKLGACPWDEHGSGLDQDWSQFWPDQDWIGLHFFENCRM